MQLSWLLLLFFVKTRGLHSTKIRLSPGPNNRLSWSDKSFFFDKTFLLPFFFNALCSSNKSGPRQIAVRYAEQLMPLKLERTRHIPRRAVVEMWRRNKKKRWEESGVVTILTSIIWTARVPTSFPLRFFPPTNEALVQNTGLPFWQLNEPCQRYWHYNIIVRRYCASIARPIDDRLMTEQWLDQVTFALHKIQAHFTVRCIQAEKCQGLWKRRWKWF